MRDTIENVIASIVPFDGLEQNNITDSVRWISSGVEIFRIKKPDIPPKHLVSYFVLLDKKAKRLLLINHIKAGLWLPPGGHIEKDEDPIETVKREIQEELGIRAKFLINNPFFITVTKTVNIDAGHVDVSLWYLLRGDSKKKLSYDSREISDYKWFLLEEILRTKEYTFNPEMKRFTNKLLKFLGY